MTKKKVFGVISNIIDLFVYTPLSYLAFLFAALCAIGRPDPNLMDNIIIFIFLGTPVFCILSIILSLIFRKKDKTFASYLIQFSPLLTFSLAYFLAGLTK